MNRASADVAASIVDVSRDLYDRRLATGSAGNVSVRDGDGATITPTGACLGRLDIDELSSIDLRGRHVGGPPASKETHLHVAIYRARPELSAVVHLHCTHAVAVSCLAEDERRIPVLTAYYAMRIGDLGHIGYHPPGDVALAEAIAALASRHHAVLLANHGPVVAASSLTAAADAIEELEETAKIHLLLRGQRIAPLGPGEVEALRSR